VSELFKSPEELEKAGFINKKEACKKYSISLSSFYQKTRNKRLETKNRGKTIFYQINDLEKVLKSKSAYGNCYDRDFNLVALSNIDLKNGAYLTRKQISKILDTSTVTIKNKMKENAILFKKEYLGDKKVLHYLVNSENMELLKRKNPGDYKNEGYISFNELARDLEKSNEDLFKKIEELQIEPKDNGNTHLISKKDADIIRKSYN
jgi:hypothetical protein